MAWSNIYLELISITGAHHRRGRLLDGWETSIELEKLRSWGMTYNTDGHDPAAGKSGVLGAIGGAASGACWELGGNRAKMNVLTIEQTVRHLVGNDPPPASTSTCRSSPHPSPFSNIKHGGRAIHEPGFVLLATPTATSPMWKLSMSVERALRRGQGKNSPWSSTRSSSAT